MAYDDSSLEALFDDPRSEGWDREWSEAFPNYTRRPMPHTPAGFPKPPTPVAGVRGGTITTSGGGRGQVTLPTAVAAKDAVDAAIKELKADIAKQAEAINRVDKTLDTNTAMLDKKINGVSSDLKKLQQNSQFSSMLPLLLTRPPDIDSFTDSDKKTTTVTATKYKSGDNTGLLLAMMAMGGGLGGSGGLGGDGSSSALMLALAFGAFDKKN